MVSSRAKEYIIRFSKGVQNNTALKKIVEYRDECKGLYRAAECKNPMNYRAAEDKRIYLEDMLDRIHCLGEARDYLQKDINKKASAKADIMHSAVAFVPENGNKTKRKYFERTETDLRKIGIKDAIEALDTAVEYFSELQETINSEEFESKYVYNAGTDEYVEKSKPTKKQTKKPTKKPTKDSEDDWEDFQRVWGRT